MIEKSISLGEARQLLNRNIGQLHFKYVGHDGFKVTVYPSNLDEALQLKKETDSAYSIWYTDETNVRMIVDDVNRIPI